MFFQLLELCFRPPYFYMEYPTLNIIRMVKSRSWAESVARMGENCMWCFDRIILKWALEK